MTPSGTQGPDAEPGFEAGSAACKAGDLLPELFCWEQLASPSSSAEIPYDREVGDQPHVE